MLLTYVFVTMVGLYTAIAAVIDFRLHRIPNYVTVPGAILGLLYHAFMPNGWGVLTSLAGFAVGFLLLLVPWLLGGGGMGDVKLLAALGAWLGPTYMLVAFTVSIMMAAVMALSVLIQVACTQGVSVAKRRYLSGGIAPQQKKGRPAKKPTRVLPFAVPVAMSTWILLAWFVEKGTI